jgi:acyl-CoA synthetase (AMP-forming)/AMP-acid ligase II
MSETSTAPRRALHLVVVGFPEERLGEIADAAAASKDNAEIFRLTPETAKEALEKIFAADSVAVWGKVE